MSNSKANKRYKLIQAENYYFEDMQTLCKRVYPFSKPWSLTQLEAHQNYFPEGQFLVIDTQKMNRVVGMAFSLIIAWDDYSFQDNWVDFTSSGFFHNHDPKKGKTLYGAEVMVDPEYRGQGIGKMLYAAREQLAKDLKLKRIRAGARLRGYVKFQEKMTADDYTKKIVQGDIFDPTLSFQLARGFRVIDVAKNYLSNDPESLGYAAVIEWLNPERTNERDLKKQNESIEAFLNDTRLEIEHLPKDLRRLVRTALKAYGQVIETYEGKEFFEKIEFLRQQLKKNRVHTNVKSLEKIQAYIRKESSESQLKMAHGFALYMEILNLCETAYRTFRLRNKKTFNPLSKNLNLYFVLTAHPTESRGQQVISRLDEVTKKLIDGLNNQFVFDDQGLRSLLSFLWLNPLHKTKKPSVMDEAVYIYSHIFKPEILSFLLREKSGFDLRLRSWVGGDKDGHPDVNEKVFIDSLSLSRKHLIQSLTTQLSSMQQELSAFPEKEIPYRKDMVAIAKLRASLKRLLKIDKGDDQHIHQWIRNFENVLKHATAFTQNHDLTLKVKNTLASFPALVVPLEFREHSDLIHKALKDPQQPIARMLAKLSEISNKKTIDAYVKGLVISHCESSEDLLAAQKLIQNICKTHRLPVIPLLESKSSLKNAAGILDKWLSHKSTLDAVKKDWNNEVEVMLGYSDSAKEIGVLPSRTLVRNSLYQIQRILKLYDIQPVFFHGSGGSVARGGGSIKEQISWWPSSALKHPKLTIQGEMVQRTFATPEILQSQCQHFKNETISRRGKPIKVSHLKSFIKFVDQVESAYSQLVSNPDKISYLLENTPYSYLDVLKLGSRPSRRKPESFHTSQLRAIPWVLSWTQTRLLLPTWWGVGSSWKSLNAQEQEEIRENFQHDPMFSSYVKLLGFTLEKANLEVFRFYNSDHQLYQELKAEYDKTIQFVRSMSGERNLLWYRPWLEESIRLRSPNIHLLNLLQVEAIAKNDEDLLRTTLVGIACGMMTTG